MTDNPEKKSEEQKQEEKDVRTPEQKVQDILKPYDFIKFTNGAFLVNHDELTATLKPRLLTMGAISERGRNLSALNGGASLQSIDPETLSLNTFLATIQVSFDGLNKDVLKIEDANLIDALYLAAKSYNAFFRKYPLGINI